MLKQCLKAALVAVLVSGAFVAGPAIPQAQAQTAEISLSVFYQELAPYGRWFEHPRWGWVWFPTSVDSEWRPYTRGRWVWTTDYGWYWEAEEPFGWAVYHYGRWAYDEQYGWSWIPGTVWGPAWVAFREGQGYAGWAPLPPETLYDTAPTYESPYTEMSADYYQPRWVFVSFNYFLSPRVGVHAARWNDNRRYFGRTRNVTRYATAERRVANRSIAPERIRSVTGRPVAVTRINDVRQPGATRAGRRDRGPNVVNIYRPQIRATTDAPPPAARVRANERPRVAIRREAVPPSERRIPERGVPPSTVTKPDSPASKTPPSTVAKPETPTPRTPRDVPRTATPNMATPSTVTPKTTTPNTVTKPLPPTQAAPGQPPRTVPPTTITRPQPPTHAAPPPPPKTFTQPPPARPAPPSVVTRPSQPPTHAAPPPRTAPPTTVARPPQPPVHVAPPQRTAPPPTVARPTTPPVRVAPPQRTAPPPTVARPTTPPARPAPPAAKPATPPPAKPAARPSCGGPGQAPCPR